MSEQHIGFTSDEIRTDLETRNARLKWVIVVDAAYPAGRATNASACVALATAAGVTGMLGSAAVDGNDSQHPGLPWAGCTVLAADAAKLRQIREKGARREDVFVADMPIAAQETRVYDEYLTTMAVSPADEISYVAVSLVGPRKVIDRIVGGLRLLP